MNKEIATAKRNAIQRKGRVRAKIVGSADKPRLTITISNYHVTAQLIDDSKGVTLAAASSVGKKIAGSLGIKSVAVGAEIAKNAKSKKIESVVFDRNGRKYHGRLEAFANAAREGGLKF